MRSMSSTDLVRLLGPRHDFAAASDDKIRRMRRIDDLTLAGTTLDRYYHVCAFFDSRDEEYAVLAPFYREGIESGEKAVHIVDPALRRDHLYRQVQDGLGAVPGGPLPRAAGLRPRARRPDARLQLAASAPCLQRPGFAPGAFLASSPILYRSFTSALARH